jgi:hypothetical protein
MGHDRVAGHGEGRALEDDDRLHLARARQESERKNGKRLTVEGYTQRGVLTYEPNPPVPVQD